MPSRAPFWLILCLGLAVLGCGSKASVALSAVLTNPSVEVERSAVGADVSGAFDLELRLGDYAEDGATVSLGTFAIQRAGVDVLAPLSLDGQRFPVTLGVGDSNSFAMTFLQSSDLAVADSLCEGELVLFGSFTDTLSDGRLTTVQTAMFEPDCP